MKNNRSEMIWNLLFYQEGKSPSWQRYQVGFETNLRYYDNHYTDEGFDDIISKTVA